MHVPFCSHKCHYCDFYSIVDTQDRMDTFCARLVAELRGLAPHGGGAPLRTIFVGGGTPSLLGAERWRGLLRAMGELFDLSLMKRRRGVREEGELPDGEFTVECNPESASLELFQVLIEGGVNRVSLGAQSFHARHLRTLERQHDPENVFRAIEAARRAGVPRQSLDLIYAVPGQTIGEWLRDLETALTAGTTHVSCYNLTYEPNTAMTSRLNGGEFTPIDEETEVEMFLQTRAVLRGSGLAAYEVSNFARASQPPGGDVSGHECRHNLAYWRQEQWLAAGPSASGHVFASEDPRAGGYRWKNTPRLGDYLAGSVPDSGEWHSPVVDVEAPDPARAVRERVMTGLRLSEGLDRELVLSDAEAASGGAGARLLRRARPYEDRGLLTREHGRWTLTEAAMLRADGIAADLMRAIV